MVLKIRYDKADFPTPAAFLAATGRNLPIVDGMIKVVAPIVQPGQSVEPNQDLDMPAIFGLADPNDK